MTVKDMSDGKLVVMAEAFDTRSKKFYIFYVILFVFLGLFWPAFIISFGTYSLGILLFCLAVAGVALTGAYRFLNKALKRESLQISKNTLSISRGGFFNRSAEIYDVSQVTNFRYRLQMPEKDHPLAGKSFDYLGFQTQQQMISEMHGDDKLAFDYEGKTVTFGERIYSWDFEQLTDLLLEVTGRNFIAAKPVLPEDDGQETDWA